MTKNGTEAGDQPDRVGPWRKSSFSDNINTCVELAPAANGHVLLRDSKHPSGPVLRFSHRELRAFLSGIARGEFDSYVTG